MNSYINNNVQIGGNQTITGAKNFSGAITGTTATFSGAITGTTAGNSTNDNTIASTKFVKNVCNTSGAGVVTFSKAANGYYKFNNGLIIQWGTAAAASSRTITYPTAFSNTNHRFVWSFVYSSGELYAGATSGKSTTGITIKTAGGANSAAADWIAIGY